VQIGVAMARRFAPILHFALAVRCSGAKIARFTRLTDPMHPTCDPSCTGPWISFPIPNAGPGDTHHVACGRGRRAFRTRRRWRVRLGHSVQRPIPCPRQSSEPDVCADERLRYGGREVEVDDITIGPGISTLCRGRTGRSPCGTDERGEWSLAPNATEAAR
jgi:hypothetical protein